MVKGTASMLATAMLFVGGIVSAGGERSACDDTSEAARKACNAGASDDFWIAVGTCDNLAGVPVRKKCLADAEQARTDAQQECRDQFDARDDLCDQLGQAPYDPLIDPANFRSPGETAANPNPYFPLVPGTTWVYEGAGETITVTVTDRTREIIGVTTTEVHDVVRDEHGEPLEDTLDWYAQDLQGNVWYFGELSQGFENGELASLDGTWRAGVEGAKPGIIMEAAPNAGDVYRQEFALGVAEDAAEVIGTTASEAVPAASCDGDCLLTRDFTPIEPDVEENKYYAKDVGLILEVDPETGERIELVSVSLP